MADPRRPLALVTGASGGIGEALAHAFAKGGHDVALVARSGAKLETVAEAVRRHGVLAHPLAIDLLQPAAGAALEARVAERGLTVDALVNNAGYGLAGAILAQDLEDQLAMVDLNCRLLTELCVRFGHSMQARGRGGILNVASTAAFQPGPFMAVYYATKAYVLSFTEALNHELRGSGVNATALCPGPVATGFQSRAGFDESMALLKVAPVMTAEAVAQAGFEGLQRRRPVVIPGAANAMMARSAAFTPRGVLLRVVEGLQKKKGAS